MEYAPRKGIQDSRKEFNVKLGYMNIQYNSVFSMSPGKGK
jgi:hypothetical protein